MMGLAVQIELTNNVPVQRPHDADPGQHRRPVMFGNQQWRVHRGLPSVGVVFCLGQPGGSGIGSSNRRSQTAVGFHAAAFNLIQMKNLGIKAGPPLEENLKRSDKALCAPAFGALVNVMNEARLVGFGAGEAHFGTAFYALRVRV
jgi:hypothetical protein